MNYANPAERIRMAQVDMHRFSVSGTIITLVESALALAESYCVDLCHDRALGEIANRLDESVPATHPERIINLMMYQYTTRPIAEYLWTLHDHITTMTSNGASEETIREHVLTQTIATLLFRQSYGKMIRRGR